MDRLRDRAEAGRKLARRLEPLHLDHPLVVALPRGGVPVGVEIAQALSAPLDVLVVRKLGAPGNPEFGLGAVGEDGAQVLDPESLAAAGYSESDLSAVIRQEKAEVERRIRVYRAVRPPVDRRDRTVILVDDGAATGGTATMAARLLRAQGARRLVIALGVAPPDTCRLLAREADDLIVLIRPAHFYAVGQFYEEFDPVDEAEVLRLLERASKASGPG